MSPKQQGLAGLLVAFVFALPLFVWSAINVNFNSNERADDEPNFCGGTCGSNYNCQANFFCFEGFCRNPICASDTDCICNTATIAPTIVATKISKATPKITLKPTPIVTPVPKGGNVTPDPNQTIIPIAYFTPVPTPEDLVTTSDLKNQIWTDFAKYLIGIGAFVIISTLIYIAVKNRNNKIPHIMPPTNI